MNIAYIRVSSNDQNTTRQFAALKDKNIEKIFEEKISGKNMDRPKLKEMLEFVRDGDVIYIESISRLGRSLKDLLEIVDILNAKTVGLISLKESVIDTTTPQGKLIFSIFASLSEFERETIRQRQREGIDIAKSEGKYKGRKKQEINKEKFEAVYMDWKSGKCTGVKAMELLEIKKNTFYRRIKEYEEAL